MALTTSPDTANTDTALARWRHTLRSPLNAILMATAVLETAAPDSQAFAQARRIIARQARNLAWLISDLPGGDDSRA